MWTLVDPLCDILLGVWGEYMTCGPEDFVLCFYVVCIGLPPIACHCRTNLPLGINKVTLNLVMPETLSERGSLICWQCSCLKAIISVVFLPSYNTDELQSITVSGANSSASSAELERNATAEIHFQLHRRGTKESHSLFNTLSIYFPTVHCGLPTCFWSW